MPWDSLLFKGVEIIRKVFLKYEYDSPNLWAYKFKFLQY